MRLFDPHAPPSPSPPSSPILEPDSSPPGSPDRGFLSLNDDEPLPAPGWTHPMGGTYNQTQRPPQYERRADADHTPTRPAPPEPAGFAWGMTSSPMRDRYGLPVRDEEFVRREIAQGRAKELAQEGPSSSPGQRTLKRTHTQVAAGDDMERWAKEISDVFLRTGNTNDERTIIDLSGANLFEGSKLRNISPAIGEVNKLVVLSPHTPTMDVDVFGSSPSPSRSFSRNRTVPANPVHPGFVNRTRIVSRTSSQPALKADWAAEENLPPRPTHAIHMFLYSNAIADLPDRLFELMNLTVLTLRNNELTIIPPAISFLVNLRDLNLASNRIEYLPAEMLQMPRLETLTISGNPLRTPPESLAKAADDSLPPRLVSQTLICAPGLPTLAELCLRRLIAPVDPDAPPIPLPQRRGIYDRRTEARTVLAALYTLIQPGEARLSPLIVARLRACAPEAVARSTNDKPQAARPAASRVRQGTPVFFGVCPSPAHATRHAFYEHAEECMSWEARVGQAEFGSQPVPMLWRGCMPGCLDFLEDAPAPAPVVIQEPKMRTPELELAAPAELGRIRFDVEF